MYIRKGEHVYIDSRCQRATRNLKDGTLSSMITIIILRLFLSHSLAMDEKRRRT